MATSAPSNCQVVTTGPQVCAAAPPTSVVVPASRSPANQAVDVDAGERVPVAEDRGGRSARADCARGVEAGPARVGADAADEHGVEGEAARRDRHRRDDGAGLLRVAGDAHALGRAADDATAAPRARRSRREGRRIVPDRRVDDDEVGPVDAGALASEAHGLVSGARRIDLLGQADPGACRHRNRMVELECVQVKRAFRRLRTRAEFV